MGRRMAATAAELVTERLPAVPYRQWVFTLPFALRFALAANRRFLSAVLSALLSTLFTWMRRRALALDPSQLRDAIFLPETARTGAQKIALALTEAEATHTHTHTPEAETEAESAPDSALDRLDLTRIDLRLAQPGAVSFVQRFTAP